MIESQYSRVYFVVFIFQKRKKERRSHDFRRWDTKKKGGNIIDAITTIKKIGHHLSHILVFDSGGGLGGGNTE